MCTIQHHRARCSVCIKYCPLLRLNIPFKFCFTYFGILCHLYPLTEHPTHRYFISSSLQGTLVLLRQMQKHWQLLNILY